MGKLVTQEVGKQGPAGQRCVHGHIKHMKHMYEAHLAHPAHHAHSAMSMLDCPNDFHRENRSFSALKKTGYTGTDGRTDRPTDGRTDTTSYRDARTHLKIQRGLSSRGLVVTVEYSKQY